MPRVSTSEKKKQETDVSLPETLTPEEEISEEIWEAKFAATASESLNKLAEKVQADIKAGKTGPLDFKNR